MPFPRNSLRAFLAHAKSSLHASLHPNPTPTFTFVIGNESAGSCPRSPFPLPPKRPKPPPAKPQTPP